MLSAVECLINHGADVNKANNEGDSPLIIAAFNKRLSVVEYLVIHGAEVNGSTNDGRSALYNAS